MYREQEVSIHLIKEEDLPRLWELIYKEEQPEWKKWDAPYYPHQTITYEAFLLKKEEWVGDEQFWVIEVSGVVRGIVSYYWEHKPSNWLEIGIVLHEAHSWGKGIGTRALTLWIDHLFTTMPLVRVGLTTWSGNERMMHVGEKLGMQLEARIRKVRLYQGTYYDSIHMGILREEWLQQKNM
ncbi:MAG: GNAT family N-acetyltransferase [Kurthia sp.]|nr:GNAT family N-acetyltransferase [Candidatus Kurthia equi]